MDILFFKGCSQGSFVCQDVGGNQFVLLNLRIEKVVVTLDQWNLVVCQEIMQVLIAHHKYADGRTITLGVGSPHFFRRDGMGYCCCNQQA